MKVLEHKALLAERQKRMQVDQFFDNGKIKK